MLKIPSLVSLVPNLLDQFLDKDSMDLSIIDDCLCPKPTSSCCVFGQNSCININNNPKFTANQWIKEHPLNLISECDYAPIYDHPVVITIVDSKVELFDWCNINYTYTPKYYEHSYVDFENDTCIYMCNILKNTTNHFNYFDNEIFILYIFRFILYICACAALLKEFIQILTQRGRYFRAFFS